MQLKHILISRTDSIGDVVLTLPLAGILKQHFPSTKITFLGQQYTRPVIEACPFVDVFLEKSAFLQSDKIPDGADTAILHVFPDKEIALHAKRLGIRTRVGTKSRWYHWLSCNQLIWLKRKKSSLHEAQLNAKLLWPLGIKKTFSREELAAVLDLSHTLLLPEKFKALLDPGKQHVILHPKSKGSAIEWGLEHFAALANALEEEQYQVFVSGTIAEREHLKPFFDAVKRPVSDITGQMSLSAFMAFIKAADALVANSTGPLHIAAALGKKAIGLYPSVRPMHAGRWAPLGKKAFSISAQPSDPGMQSIPVAAVLDLLHAS